LRVFLSLVARVLERCVRRELVSELSVGTLVNGIKVLLKVRLKVGGLAIRSSASRLGWRVVRKIRP
jgi:hypothetical protein